MARRGPATYDSWGRLTTLANSLASVGTLASLTYGYDVEQESGAPNRLDQRTSMSVDVPSKPSIVDPISYHYDNAYQLVGANYPRPSNGYSVSPTSPVMRYRYCG